MIKKTINYILVFLLIVITTLNIVLLTLNVTLLNKNYVYKVLSKEDYYTKTYNLIMENFKDNTIQSGLDETILDSIITKEQVENDVKQIVEGLYENKEINIDKETVKNNLKENIDKVIEENNKQVLKDEQEAIDVYVETISNIYDDLTLQKYIKEIKIYTTKAQEIITTITPVVLTLNIIAIITFIKKDNKEKENNISVALIATGMLLIVPKILENTMIQIHNILILNKIVSDMIIRLTTNTTFILLIIGVLLIICGIILSILNYKNNMKK